ncbi:AAA family ATPase [Serratia marcescens]|uniref:AAA family ATPase n=1 Tax=Serratia marcescens TaxID=615 RepID=UPI0007451D66|nr:AAA family ATPase [Serratia marcescens]CVD66034.1 Predicted ATP-binding protein involved in virulence [Serratia marcescens]CVG11486.1 Predicted ATP-binding protein involved in virulence [Serratia marcescens]
MIFNLKIKNHEVFGDSEIVLSDDGVAKDANYYTLILGDNATGKSELLKAMIDSVVFMDNHSELQKKRKKEKKELTYELNNSSEYTCPDCIIASSSNLNDKFPVKITKSKINGERYKYLGIRSANNNAFVGKYKSIFYHSFIKIIENKKRLDTLKSSLEYYDFPLDFSFKFVVSKLASPLIGYGHLMGDYESFLNAARYALGKISESTSMGKDKILPILNDEGVMKVIYESSQLLFNKGNEHNLTLNLGSVVSCNDYIASSKYITILLRYGIISVEEFSIETEHTFGFKNASSGQFNLFSSLLTLSSELMDNTLLLIDEPEISLHPKWQVMYMSALREIIGKYKGCQVVIATHSHLLVSNMPIKDSSVLMSKKDAAGRITFSRLDCSPTGWSAESVLYNVFGVLSSRNSVFEVDVRKLAMYMSDWKDENICEYKEILRRLNRFELATNDPLRELVTKAKEYLDERLSNAKL